MLWITRQDRQTNKLNRHRETHTSDVCLCIIILLLSLLILKLLRIAENVKGVLLSLLKQMSVLIVCVCYLCHQACFAQRLAAFWQWQSPECSLKGQFRSLSSFASSPVEIKIMLNNEVIHSEKHTNIHTCAQIHTTVSVCPHLQQLFGRQAEFRQCLGNKSWLFSESVGHSCHHGCSFSTAALW